MSTQSSMYFVYPTRVLRQLDRALILFSDLEWIKLTQVPECDPNRIYIADVHDFLKHDWTCPTVVIAQSHEGLALSQAWKKGALAGWVWEDLPEQPYETLKLIEAKYKRNQDSRDLPAAAELQRRLLPNTLDIQNYTFRTMFQPSAYLSGDWYDHWWVDEQHVLFYLADVSGHGVTSSLLTSWMAAFHNRATSPQQLIYKLNDMLIKENIEKHITMVAGLLNIDSHTVLCCNAGHFPPIIHLLPDQEPKTYHSSSFPLGLSEDLQVDEITLHMPKGSRLVLCSDGALETFNGGLNDQLQQLIHQLTNNSFSPPDHVADHISMICLEHLGTQ